MSGLVIKAWRCIGCGRIESEETCLGICEDRRAEIVDAGAYRDALARAEAAERQYRALQMLVVQLAHVTPSEGRWKDSWEALQARARTLLADTGRD